jgi:hypothetical protein
VCCVFLVISFTQFQLGASTLGLRVRAALVTALQMTGARRSG